MLNSWFTPRAHKVGVPLRDVVQHCLIEWDVESEDDTETSDDFCGWRRVDHSAEGFQSSSLSAVVGLPPEVIGKEAIAPQCVIL